MEKARLELCITALEDAAARELHFSMRQFGVGSMPCCVLGHLAVRDDLQQAFTLTDRGSVGELTSCDTGNEMIVDSWELGEWFGLDRDDMCELFDSDGCGEAQTALEAASYIRSFISARMSD